MKSLKINSLLLIILFSISKVNSQAYYPKLNNLFISEESESVFNPETEFFRLGLRKYFNKLFYGDLQTTNNGSSRNYSSFYSLKIIPRFITETDFFDAGIKLKFDVSNDPGKYPSFPVIFNEYVNVEDENDKKGKGDVTINKGTVSIQFSDKFIPSASKGASEFLIERIEHKFKNNTFEIELSGQFNCDVKIKNSKISKDSNHSIKIVVKNSIFSMFLISDKKQFRIIEKSINKNDFKE